MDAGAIRAEVLGAAGANGRIDREPEWAAIRQVLARATGIGAGNADVLNRAISRIRDGGITLDAVRGAVDGIAVLQQQAAATPPAPAPAGAPPTPSAVAPSSPAPAESTRRAPAPASRAASEFTRPLGEVRSVAHAAVADGHVSTGANGEWRQLRALGLSDQQIARMRDQLAPGGTLTSAELGDILHGPAGSVAGSPRVVGGTAARAANSALERAAADGAIDARERTALLARGLTARQVDTVERSISGRTPEEVRRYLEEWPLGRFRDLVRHASQDGRISVAEQSAISRLGNAEVLANPFPGEVKDILNLMENFLSWRSQIHAADDQRGRDAINARFLPPSRQERILGLAGPVYDVAASSARFLDRNSTEIGIALAVAATLPISGPTLGLVVVGAGGVAAYNSAKAAARGDWAGAGLQAIAVLPGANVAPKLLQALRGVPGVQVTVSRGVKVVAFNGNIASALRAELQQSQRNGQPVNAEIALRTALVVGQRIAARR